MTIDLNCDMGEGMDNDPLIMPFISSANIACGAHAGDDDTIKQTIDLALQHHVAIGAHPSFYDRLNFGRTEMNISHSELYDLVTAQVNKLRDIVSGSGAKLHHVKPHGALYNMAARDEQMSSIIAKAIHDIDPQLVLYGLSNSHLISEARKAGLKTASEVFADRTYTDAGTLTPRSEAGALIEDEKRSMEQVLQMVREKKLVSVSGKPVSIEADTVCIHGDGKHAAVFAKNIHNTLKQYGIVIKAI